MGEVPVAPELNTLCDNVGCSCGKCSWRGVATLWPSYVLGAFTRFRSVIPHIATPQSDYFFIKKKTKRKEQLSPAVDVESLPLRPFQRRLVLLMSGLSFSPSLPLADWVPFHPFLAELHSSFICSSTPCTPCLVTTNSDVTLSSVILYGL